MFKFLLGVAFGAAGYWAWQSFGRDLLGMGDQGEATYGGFSSPTTTSSFSTPSTAPTSSTSTPDSASATAGSSSSSGSSSTGT